MTAANTIVKAPTHMMSLSESPHAAKNGKSRATRYTPATTIVALWMMEETGVGPSIAFGSQMCIGNMADLPQPPVKMRIEPRTRALACDISMSPRLIVPERKSESERELMVEKSKLPTT